VRTVRSHPGHSGNSGLEVNIPCGTQNGEVIVVKGLGMPIGQSTIGQTVQGATFGDLYVRVEVTVNEAERKALTNSKAIIQSLFTGMD
jgi:DnaJ-class molecular chaperone